MDNELIKKLDELLLILEESVEMKELERLKKEIYDDDELKQLLDKYNKEKDNQYSREKVTLKKEIIANENVSQYRKLEQDLYLLVLSINHKLKELTEEKSCSL